MERFVGLGCSDGVAFARVYKKGADPSGAPRRKAGTPGEEAARLNTAVTGVLQEMEILYARKLEQGGEEEAELYEAYLTILKDDAFFGDARRLIEEQGKSAEEALEQIRSSTEKVFLAMDNEHLRERFADINSVCGALQVSLSGGSSIRDVTLSEDTVVVADMLTPLHTIHLDKKFLKGFITKDGGPTSHAVILARTLGIPAIVNAGTVYDACRTGDRIVMSGDTGEVALNPDEETVQVFLDLRQQHRKRQALYAAEPKGKAVTRDGTHILVAANTGDDDSAAMIDPAVCDGIGLFRTEFLYMQHDDYPDEETQYRAYRGVVEHMRGKEVIIRTLDIGGDKQLGYFDIPHEENPFLGFRASRICLDRPQIFQTQLRAILRASAHGSVKIMFPMIVTLEELRQACATVEQCKAQLKREGTPFDEKVPVGVMMETPASALLAEELAGEADFFSIGTNDLIQYMTASDRTNGAVAYLCRNANISVLRAIRLIGQAAQKAGIPLGVCGEMASADEMLPFLIGCGVEELSVSASNLDKVRYLVRRLSLDECRRLAEKAAGCGTIGEVKKLLAEALPAAE